LSDADAVTCTTPLTVVPAAGAVTDTVGGTASGAGVVALTVALGTERLLAASTAVIE
jgi:hypothetical protein